MSSSRSSDRGALVTARFGADGSRRAAAFAGATGPVRFGTGAVTAFTAVPGAAAGRAVAAARAVGALTRVAAVRAATAVTGVAGALLASGVAAAQDGTAGGGGDTTALLLYVGIGVVALVIAFAAVLFLRRSRAPKTEDPLGR